MTAPRVSVVVLNWNDAAPASACLSALATVEYADPSIIVADNPSTDGSAEKRARRDGIELIRKKTLVCQRLLPTTRMRNNAAAVDALLDGRWRGNRSAR